MTPEPSFGLMAPKRSATAPIQAYVDRAIDDLLASFPEPGRLSAEERRGIIARYTAVLEGNFIYWMTATYLAVRSEEARAIIDDNLREEIRDNHPGMLRRFAIVARAVPTDVDALAIHRPLQSVRLFVGRLSAVKLVTMMAFFEGFITKFMPYLAELAARQGSTEQEYTDVHGVVDVVHTEGLFQALETEMTLPHDALPSTTELFEGVEVLRSLIQTIAQPHGAHVR
jgi:hypothetical protein